MYLNFYNMTKAPFHITPDPDFLFLSPSHKEALGAIIYGIEEKKGFVSVIGEVGTGKTTIIRSYLAKTDRQKVTPIYVFNPALTFAELLKTIFHEMAIDPNGETVFEMVQQLQTVLIQEYKQDRNIVLIIDEAQNMPVDTFEQLRTLSNIETTKEKLIQIILVGQPELADKLAGKELRQLNQRLSIRATLSHLNPKESRNYVHFRLSQVTPSPHDIFTDGAMKKIVKASHGSPRMLNILSDNALIAGLGYKKKQITTSIVKQVIADFEGKVSAPFFTWKRAWLFGILLLYVAVFQGIYEFSSASQSNYLQNKMASIEKIISLVEEKSSEKQISLSGLENFKAENQEHSVIVKKKDINAMVAKSVNVETIENIFPMAGHPASKKKSPLSEPNDLIDDTKKPRDIVQDQGGKPESLDNKSEVSSRNIENNPFALRKRETVSNFPDTAINRSDVPESVGKKRQVNMENTASKAYGNNGNKGEIILISSSNGNDEVLFTNNSTGINDFFSKRTDWLVNSALSSNTNNPESQRFPPTDPTNQEINTRLINRTVQKGDHLSKICMDVYGFVNAQLINAVKEKNPRIFDPNLIFVGDTIYFPKFSESKIKKMESQGG